VQIAATVSQSMLYCNTGSQHLSFPRATYNAGIIAAGTTVTLSLVGSANVLTDHFDTANIDVLQFDYV
jgi:hypothetical protein